MMIQQDIEKVMITEDQLQERIAELGAELTEEYKEKFPLAIGVSISRQWLKCAMIATCLPALTSLVKSFSKPAASSSVTKRWGQNVSALVPMRTVCKCSSSGWQCSPYQSRPECSGHNGQKTQNLSWL